MNRATGSKPIGEARRKVEKARVKAVEKVEDSIKVSRVLERKVEM